MQNCRFKTMCKGWTFTETLNQEFKKDIVPFIKLNPDN